MPNHCSSTIHVSNVTNEQAQRIIAAVEREELANEFMPQPEWKSTPNEDGICPGPEYYERHSRLRLWQGGPLSIISSRYPNGEHDQRWYSWNTTNWGTKWGMYDMDITYNEESNEIFITGNTAWSPLSLQWFECFSAQLPGAQVLCYFAEPGCDFYGATLAKDGCAVEVVKTMSDVKDAWAEETLSPEELAIYKDDDHPDYWERMEDINDQWYEVECDVMEKASAELVGELHSNMRDTTVELKGDALITRLKEIDFSFDDLNDSSKTMLAAIQCGYVPQHLCGTSELTLQRELGLKKALSNFSSALSATHALIDWQVKKSIEQMKSK